MQNEFKFYFEFVSPLYGWSHEKAFDNKVIIPLQKVPITPSHFSLTKQFEFFISIMSQELFELNNNEYKKIYRQQ